MRADVYNVDVLPDGWRVYITSYADESMPPKMGYRVMEWAGKWGLCALYGPVDVDEKTWAAALDYARRHSEMGF